jgi:hypothetical protein
VGLPAGGSATGNQSGWAIARAEDSLFANFPPGF